MNNQTTYKRLRKRILSYTENYPIPTPAENTENFKILRQLEKAKKYKEADKLRKDIIISNGAFGMKYAIKYSRLVNDRHIIEDLFQQSQIGLIEVTDKYDPYIGINFTTYAWHYVRKCIVDYIKKNKIVIAPRDIAKNLKVVTQALDKIYTDTKGCLVRAKEVQKELQSRGINISESIIEDTMLLIDLNSTGSSNTFMVGSVTELASEDNNKETNMLLKSLILKDISDIDPKVLDIIKMRFGIEYKRPFSLSEIKMIKGLSTKDIERAKEYTKAFLNNK